jgi:pimeloyl-ACP methyl ester carboxylesterase
MMAEDKFSSRGCFQTEGRQEGLPLVLLHGAVVSRESWLPQLKSMSVNIRAVALDLPGHGGLCREVFSFRRSICLIMEFLQESGPAVMAGMSLGGYVAIEFSSQYPELTKGLILSGCRSTTRGLIGLYLKLVGRLMKAGLLKQDRSQLESRVREMYPPQLHNAAEAQIKSGVFPESMGDVLLEMAGKDYGKCLKQYPGPIALLNGEQDGAARRGADQIRKYVPGVSETIIPNAGHSCHLDQPVAYTAALESIVFRFFENQTQDESTSKVGQI